ncbi:LysR family transcriptional regulator [Frankia sp. RB7]|nr:LysR family transcriptional regulator [Frankia sp. RB7]
MRYTLGQAEAFYWVAKLGSFRAAAAQLNLTQPTVSLRVRELERNLGTELLDRSLYRPVMTPAGVAIYADTERMLAIAEQIERRSRNSPSDERLFRIGTAESFAALILPDLLAALEARHPSWQINVEVDVSTRLETALLERSIDIAFLAQPRVHDGISVVPLWSVDSVWVIGKDCPFKGSLVTPDVLVDVPIYTTAPPSGLFTNMMAWFGARAVKPGRVVTCDTIAILARLASARGGAALVPQAMVSAFGNELGLRIPEADPPILPLNICAMWRDDAGGIECAYMANLARQLSAALSGGKLGEPIAVEAV